MTRRLVPPPFQKQNSKHRSKNPFRHEPGGGKGGAGKLKFEPSASREVLLLSPEQQRRLFLKALKDCETALEEVEELKAQWHEFQERDQPAYSAWIWAVFGGVLQEIRDVYKKIDEKSALINAVENVAMDLDCSVAEAYAIYLERKEELEAELEAQRKAQSKREEKAARKKEPESEAQSSFGFEFSESAGADPSDGESEDHTIPEMESRHRGPTRITPEFKTLYRALARKLHPDVNELDPSLRHRAAQLWHQVQEAYETGDSERLRALAAVAATLSGGGGADESTGGIAAARISDLMAVTRRYHKAAAALKRDIHGARRSDPSFGFASAKKTQALRKHAERDLAREQSEAEALLQDIEQHIAHWESGAERAKRQWERALRAGGRGRGGRSGRGSSSQGPSKRKSRK